MTSPSRVPLVAVAAAALLVGTAFAGCLAPDGSLADDDLEGLQALASTRTTAPGGTVAFPVVLGPNATDDANATLDIEVADDGGLSVADPDPVAIEEDGTGTYVTVSVPADADTGTHTVSVEGVVAGDAGAEVTLTVNVSEPDTVVETGDKVSLDYTGRFPNGTVFATNEKAINASPLPKAALYQGGGPYQPLNITVGPNAQFIQGLNEGVIGLGVGHDASISIPPAQAYGNETTEGTTNRTEEVDRTITEQWQFTGLNRSTLEEGGHINETTEEGDTFTFRGTTYNITFLNDTKVNISRMELEDLEVGDTKTHHDSWPNASEVVRKNETHIEYYVTPTTEKNETFTWYDYWPDATEVVRLTNETIFIQHTPEVGTEYSSTGQFGQQGPTRTVVDVTDDKVVYEEENTHPLAGETLVFDVTVLDAQEAQQQQQRR